jgi:ribosomal protein L7Ae-like RNA K-turn-binding protein
MQLQLIIKARAFLSGELAMRALAQGKVHYAIIAADTSLPHQNRIIERLTYYKIPYVIRLTKALMSQMIHKDQVVMIGVTDASLARLIIEKELKQ